MNWLIELFYKVKRFPYDKLEGKGFWKGYYCDSNDAIKTGLIIEDILPAVRDTQEFQEKFWEWIVKNKFGDADIGNNIRLEESLFNSAGCYCYQPTDLMLLGYELEFCKEVLK